MVSAVVGKVAACSVCDRCILIFDANRLGVANCTFRWFYLWLYYRLMLFYVFCIFI